jgi:osmotically-inducible protein OsmY
MTNRNKTHTGKNPDGNRGQDQGRGHARFGDENDSGRYGSDRSNDQDYDRRFSQDGNQGRQGQGSRQGFGTDDDSYENSDHDRSSSPFRSGNESTRQFQSTVSPFRGNSDSNSMARGSSARRMPGGQMSESSYGRDESKAGGGFSGRGPKGYERSDEKIKDEICDCLADDDNIDASDIEVNVVKGEVTLTGTVSERKAKRLAEDAVEHIKGVKDVHNQIRVQSSKDSPMSHSSSVAKNEEAEKSEKSSGLTQQKPKNDGMTARH